MCLLANAGTVIQKKIMNAAGFNPMPPQVEFLLDKMELERFFLRVLRFCPFTVIPPLTYTHSIICHRRYIILAIDTIVNEHTKYHQPLP
jgi:hypothetical protein